MQKVKAHLIVTIYKGGGKCIHKRVLYIKNTSIITTMQLCSGHQAGRAHTIKYALELGCA